MVLINTSTKSNHFRVTSGVPQGGHLLPLLFNCFINDICDTIKRIEYLLFADNLKLFKTIKNVGDCQLLQSNLDNIVMLCNGVVA